jgi:8-hydroxy-5-deazaflavin:NADPH oxidoreductase
MKIRVIGAGNIGRTLGRKWSAAVHTIVFGVRSPEMHSLAGLAAKAPGAQLARAFSTLGWKNYANPQIGGIQLDLFFCAQPAARPVVEPIIREVDLRPVYLGDLDLASAVDGMTRIWFALACGQNRGRQIAFKLLVEN